MCISINIPDIQISYVSHDVLDKFSEYLSSDFQSSVQQPVSLNMLPGATPVFSRARPIPVKLRDQVKLELQRLVETGKLTKVFSSDYASPIVVCFKKNGDVRICGDFSVHINKHLDPVQSPLPTVDDVMSRTGRATVFSQIDLMNAFLQLPLDEVSKQFTTINTSEGLFTYNYLPFGLCASPGIFQAFITKILNGIDDIIVYQDDILILSPDRHSHSKTLHSVLSSLRNAGVKVNSDKCKFFTDEVQYLGHVFSSRGVCPNPDKVKAITSAPAPVNIKQVQAFLGMCNYYSRFIPNFATVLAPLYALLKKNVPFHWGSEQHGCFVQIKRLFQSYTLLKSFDPNHETMLETDSSGYGIAAVLFQRDNTRSPWDLVQCASRTLNAAERNCSNIEREALSIVFGVEKFRHYLLGSKFTICNDQRPLSKLFSHDAGVPSTCSARIQRWKLKLSQFNYVLHYSKGCDNVTSDCLSRMPLLETVEEFEPYELVCAINSIDSSFVTSDQIKQQTDRDPDLVQLKQFIKFGCPDKIVNPTLSKFKSLIPQMTLMRGCIMYNNRVFIPQASRKTVLNQMHEGHPGILGMKSLARSLIWYPGLDKDIELLVKSCPNCQSVRSLPKQSNIQWPTPSRPWSRIHVDHFQFNDKICLIAVDSLSKYIECEIVASTSVSETMDALRAIFSRNGLCDVLVSDNASCFTAANFQDFLCSNGIKHITPPPYSPSSNGQAERGVRVVKELLKKQNLSGSFKSRLARALFHYRCVPHSVTQISPCIALNNRRFVARKDRINPNYYPKFESEDKYKLVRQFKVGNKVLALNVREGKKWYPATVVEKIGINVYNVHVFEFDVIWKRHLNQLLAIPDTSDVVSLEPENVLANQTDHTSEPPTRRSVRARNPVSRYGWEN